MTIGNVRGPLLDPRVTKLLRPSGVVQLGWDPERALLVQPPGLPPEVVMAFLNLLDGSRTDAQVIREASAAGVPADTAAALLSAMDGAGLLIRPEQRLGQVRSVRVHGLGPISDALVLGLRRLGIRAARSRGYGHDIVIDRWRADLVLLADDVIVDPQLVNDLIIHRIAHLHVRLRDGKGIIGPLVLPGQTSCLRCADLTRTDFDPDWPHLAAQLLGRVGHATPSAIAATVGLALEEVESIVACSTSRTPATLDTTLELDTESMLIQRRYWVRHAECGCRLLAG